MKYLLDTNTCIRYLNGRSPQVFKRLEALSEADIVVCSIVKLELRYGALRSNYIEKTLAKRLSDTKSAKTHGRILQERSTF